MASKTKSTAARPCAAIVVTSEVDGFRRGGRVWSRTPKTVLLAEIDAATVAALEAEPKLTVEYIAAIGTGA